MTPKGADLEATDLIEVSTIESGSYVTRSITGQELIDAIPLPPTGLTVGTTPIASGTIGRVLFQGTGNVLQQSANLFWDDTNGRLGVNTVTPGARLEINGESRFSMACTTKNGAGFFMSDATTSYQPYAGIYTDTAANELFVKSYSNINFGWSATPGAVMSTRIMTLKSATGNVLINTTTDAGFRLDVNGTARVATSLNTPAVFSTGGPLSLYGGFTNRGRIDLFNSTTGLAIDFQGNGSSRMQLHSNGNLLIGTTTDAGFRLDVNGTARVTGTGSTSATTSLTVRNSAGTAMLTVKDGGVDKVVVMPSAVIGQIEISGLNIGAGGGNTVSILNPVAIGGTLAVASARLQVDSTDRGFLPPRQTQAQRTAIASPAVGLIVYQTDLVEGLYIYKSTGWTFVI